MSFIQKLFKTKPAPPEDSMDGVSLDMSVDPLATGAMDASGSATMARLGDGDGPESQSAEDVFENVEKLAGPGPKVHG